MSDLECWTEGSIHSYDPFTKAKAQELDECLDIAREVYQQIRSSSLENLSSLTSQEKLAIRQCFVQGLSIIIDNDLHRKIEECLKMLRDK
jgi:uncharacterized protein with ATP-grasp and redox domains